MANSETRSEIVLALAEEFLEHYRKGERPSIKEYTDRHPDLAGEIREVFSAMAMMEKIAIAEDSMAEPGDRQNAAPAHEQLGDYRIIREIGRGGMGIVYEAEQVSLGRHVALKVLPNKALLNAAQQLRFEREAKSAAKLHHTNIVPVFGVGEQNGLPYYVMQFIQGLGLNEVLVELSRQQSQSATRSHGENSCEVSAADLASSLFTGKLPAGEMTIGKSNVENEETTKERLAADSRVTPNSSVMLPGQSCAQFTKRTNYWHSIATIGTQVASALDYAHSQGILHRDIKPSNLLLDRRGTVWVTDFGLAKSDDQENLTHTGDILGTLRYMPPEAFEGKSDRRSDVYSLGITLYELLAMQPAFVVKDRNQLIRQVTTTEPPRLEMLNPAIPRDLVTIVHKAIERDARNRYANAGDFEADLRRYLDDEPIQARRISTAERLQRWCRRQPAAAAAGTFALLLLAALVALPITLAVYEARNSAALAKEKTKVDDALKTSRERSAVLALEQALGVCEQGDVARGMLLLARGLQRAHEVRAADLEQAFRWNLGAWSRENHELIHAMRHGANVWSVAFSRDSKFVASGGEDNQVRLWDVATGLPHGTPLIHPNRVHALAFHPDGRLLTGCADGVARLWDVTTCMQDGVKFVHYQPGATTANDLPFQQGIYSVAFSPDGRTILTGGHNGFVNRWVTDSGQLRGEPLRHPGGPIRVVAFSPLGKHFLTAGDGSICCLWNTETEEIVSSTITESNIFGAAIHPFGNKFATALASEWGVRQWQTPPLLPDPASRTGQKQFAPLNAIQFGAAGPRLQHYDLVNAVAYTPDGALLLTGSNDRTAKLWDASLGRPLGSSLQHNEQVLAVGVSPDNRLAVTGSSDGTVRLWQISRGSKFHTLSHPGGVKGLAFDHRSNTVLTGGAKSGSSGGIAIRWEISSGKQIGPPFLLPSGEEDSWVSGVALSLDGMTVYAADYRGQVVRFWDAYSGRLLGSTLPHGDEIWRVAISPDGYTLLTGTENRGKPNGTSARLWHALTGQPIGEPLKHGGRVWALAFSPDGKAVLTGSEDRTTRLWDAATGTPLGPSLAHSSAIKAVAFRSDGKVVALGSSDHTAQVRIGSTWRPAGPVMQHEGEVNCVAFNPKGDLLLTASTDFTARIWHVATAKRIGPALRHAHEVLAVSCSPNGRIVGTVSEDRTAGLWAMPVSIPDDPEQVWRWAQRITGLTIDEDNVFHVLSPLEIARLGVVGREFNQGHWAQALPFGVPRELVLLKALKGEPVVKDAAELMDLARFASHKRQIFAGTADLFRVSFKTHPDWIDAKIPPQPDGLAFTNRRYAAAVAVMAAGGQGDALTLNVEQRAVWMRQGLEWMRAELESWSQRLESATPEEAIEILELTKPDPWLALLRNPDYFDMRPAAERDAFRQLWAVSAHVYDKAFAIEPKLAENMQNSHRYNAARDATLAGCGPSNEADKLQIEERAHLRQKALEWLRADLAHLARQSQFTIRDREAVRKRMRLWQDDPDLAGIRVSDALAILPADEGQDWRKLWAEVKELWKKSW